VLGQPHLAAARLRLVAERAVRAVVAGHRREEVVGLLAVLVGGLVGLLAAVAGARQVAVGHPRRELVADDRHHRRSAHPQLAAVRVLRGPDDRVGRHLGLVDGRHRPRALGHAQADEAELRGVHAGQVDGRHVHVALVVHELAAQAVGEPADRVLGAAVGGLQRDPAVGQRRADLDDRPVVARDHPLQGGHRAVHLAEVGHLGRAAELLGRDLVDRREDRGHRVVDPHVDRPELGGDAVGGGVDLGRVGDVGGDGQRAPPLAAHLVRRGLEAVLVAGQQGDVVAAARERARHRAADPGRRPGDDDDHGCAGSPAGKPANGNRSAPGLSRTRDGVRTAACSPIPATCSSTTRTSRARWRAGGCGPPSAISSPRR
jgi:hypothetical protein